MTDEEKLILVKLITTNHNTFHDIKQALPMLTEAEIKATYKNPISITKTPDEYAIYKFKDTDTFILTEEGKNILYHFNKQSFINDLVQRNCTTAEMAIRYARKSYYATLLIGIVSIAVSLITLGLTIISFLK